MSDVGVLTAVGSAQVSAAVAGQVLTGIELSNGLAGLSGWIRFAGTGGTSVAVYLQESPDGGTTWFDVYCAKFVAAGVALFSLAHGAGANLAANDAALADNTALNSGVVPMFGDWRLKYTSVGTWVNGTLACHVMPRG